MVGVVISVRSKEDYVSVWIKNDGARFRVGYVAWIGKKQVALNLCSILRQCSRSILVDDVYGILFLDLRAFIIVF